jgi:hypothetical protein
VLGRLDAAAAHFEEALRREEAARARLAAISSRVGLARVLADRDAPGDAARAEALIGAVAAESKPLGVDWQARFRFPPPAPRRRKR